MSLAPSLTLLLGAFVLALGLGLGWVLGTWCMTKLLALIERK